MADGVPKKLNINRLRPRFIELVKERIEDGRIPSQVWLSEKTGIKEGHLSYLLNEKRPLTANYIDPLIKKGIIDVDDIYDGNPESAREEEYWGQAQQYKHSVMLYKIQTESGLNDEEMIDLIKSMYEAAGKRVNLPKLIKAATPE